jgi:hypothetical protein
VRRSGESPAWRGRDRRAVRRGIRSRRPDGELDFCPAVASRADSVEHAEIRIESRDPRLRVSSPPSMAGVFSASDLRNRRRLCEVERVQTRMLQVRQHLGVSIPGRGRGERIAERCHDTMGFTVAGGPPLVQPRRVFVAGQRRVARRRGRGDPRRRRDVSCRHQHRHPPVRRRRDGAGRAGTRTPDRADPAARIGGAVARPCNDRES